jgi:periplasmic protein TonB
MDPLIRPRTRARSRFWILPVSVIAAMALLVWCLSTLMRDAGPVRKYEPPHITQVMLPPPPPPPPPPPKPEPPKEQKMVETKPFEPMKPQPNKPPPDSALTAQAGPGANNFGLQVGDGSGTRIGGNGGGGSPFAGYATVVQQAVQQMLQRDEDTRKGRYGAVVALWIAADGTIQRSKIISSAGKPELDSAIVHALQGQSLPQVPPADMPQPINLRIGAIAPG